MGGRQIGVLGPVVLLADRGAPVPLRSPRQRLLLAILVARSGRVVTAGELVDALWGAELPADPLAALHSQVSRLRRVLGPAGAWLETAGTDYRFAGGPQRVDADRLEELLAAVRAQVGEPDATLGWLEAALGLWRGPAYLEVAEHEQIRAEARRLEELRAKAAEARAELLVAVGRVDEAAQAMERLEGAHPFRERPVALRMRALARQGRHADALRAFGDFRRRLADDLGLEPSPDLQAVEGEVLRHEQPAPALVPVVGLPGNAFIGRRAEVEACSARLAQARLVTLTGPPGVGKTRLALHVAVAVADRYPDGVYLCELAGVTDPHAVPAAMASVLGVEARAGRSVTERVMEFLRTRRALLVLDNCEHVLASAANLVAGVLARTTDIDVLATSRQRLGVDGEQRLPVDPLPTPVGADLSGPAVALFADRAAALRPEMALSEATVAAVCELCRRLDGLPLALELAAARTISRSPSELLAEMAGRLDRLADRARVVDRHRSIDAVVGWSYELLDPGQQAVFASLSVFASGWSDEAAAAVVGAEAETIVDQLSVLVEHSLVAARDLAGRTRFSMLEPVRQHAEARLRQRGLLHDARARHASWTVSWTETADIGLRGPDEHHWRALLDEEFANLRAAQQWCLEHDADGAVRLAAALYWYAHWSAPSEIFAWADKTVDLHAGTPHPRLASAFATAALGAWRQGDLTRARALAVNGTRLAHPEDPTVTRLSWQALGDIEVLDGHFGRAFACYDQALALSRRAGDHYEVVIDLLNRALALAYASASDEAAADVEAAAPLLAELGDTSSRAFRDFVAGEIRLETAPDEALPHLRRSVDAARRVGNRFVAGIAGLSGVSCAARLGDPAGVMDDYAELLHDWHRSGAWTQAWITIRTLIEALTRLGRDEPATILHGALTASPSASPVAGADAARLADAVAALQARLGHNRFERLHAEGASLDDEQALTRALDHLKGARRR